MTTINRRKSRLHVVLMIALALGAGSAALSGALATMSGPVAAAPAA